uniref:Uncharacterized protein n=1 Tax=Arundo donax TaxID=35708 RepID=A0A0A9BA06_ARUDO
MVKLLLDTCSAHTCFTGFFNLTRRRLTMKILWKRKF